MNPHRCILIPDDYRLPVEIGYLSDDGWHPDDVRSSPPGIFVFVAEFKDTPIDTPLDHDD